MNQLICIFDKKASQHYEPKITRNVAQMIRDFMDICNDPKSSICKYPEDFSLVSLGTWNDITGELITNRKVLVEAVSCKRNVSTEKK